MTAGFAHDAALEYLADAHTPETVRYGEQFFWFEGSCYDVVPDEVVKLRLTKFLARKATVEKNPKVWNEVAVTDSFVRDVLLCVKAEAAAPTSLQPGAWLKPSPFEFVGPLLPAGGSLIDIGRLDHPGEYLLPATPNLFSLAALPVRPDPQAGCELWLQFLSVTFRGDAAAVALLQEIFGYCLWPDCRFDRFFIFYGDGATGKSTCAEVLYAILGQLNVCGVPLEQFGKQFGLASLVGKLANIVFDAAGIDHAGEGNLKAIISGEPVAVDRKHREMITQRVTAKILLVANGLPTFSDTSGGLWRRLQVLQFQHVVPAAERDVNLKLRLKGELSGILHWALQGLGRLLRQDGFTRYRPGEALLEQYRRNCNPVALFLDEECVIDAAARESRNASYARFRSWNSDNGFRPISRTEFNRKIDQLQPQPTNLPRNRRGGDRMFVGFRLRAADIISEFRELLPPLASRN